MYICPNIKQIKLFWCPSQSVFSFKNILYSAKYNSKIALCLAPPPPTADSHKCFKGIKTWLLQKTLSLEWLPFSRILLGVCNIQEWVQSTRSEWCIRFFTLCGPRCPTRPHFEGTRRHFLLPTRTAENSFSRAELQQLTGTF